MNLDRLITETVRRRLLVENAINNSRDAARKMVVAKFGCTEEYANNVVEEIRGLVGLEDKMRKFIKGCTRMFLNGEFKDQRILGDFKDALNKIKTDGHIGEFDSDLRRLDQPENAVNSAKDIISIFKPEIDRERAEQRKKLSGMTFEENSDYNIVKINSFEDARKYSRYTSWCVTSNEINYDGYTGNGINQFYFCLQNGFEKLTNNGDFNNKKDPYALSMLAILVNPEGELIHCTNRKNNDQSTLNPEGISELVGRNFYDTFKPSTTWRDTLEDVKNKLANGVPVEEVFDRVQKDGDLVIVRLLERWNYLVEGNTFLCDRWYDGVYSFHEGFAEVYDENNGCNFINREGKEISDRWYNEVDGFSEGFAKVEYYDKGYNFINSDGKEICDRWYDSAHYFSEGFAVVEDYNKGCNFINREGKEICGRWYDDVCDFYEGFAVVRDENKGCNFINRDGKEICNRWYDEVSDFHEGFAVVRDENKGYNLIDSEGNEICGRWYNNVHDFSEGFARVWDVNKGWNFINREGKEICNRWYDSVRKFSEGFAKVRDNKKGYNLIDSEGNEICDRWYNEVDDFSEGFARVKYGDKGYNFINRDGKEICDRWYDYIFDFKDGFAVVKDNNKGFNFVNREGNEVFGQWYKYVSDFSEGFAEVNYKGKYYRLRKDGVLCDNKTKKPIEDGPTHMAESIINRLVRDVLNENRKRYYL